jgi:hypothetical protein
MDSTTRLRGRAVALLAVLGLLVPGTPGNATSVLPMTVVDLLTHSQDIVVGKVEKVTDGFDTKGLPFTEVTLKVSDTIRGNRVETYTFRQFGLDRPRKLADGSIYSGRPQGWPTWRKDEVAVVFMYSKARRSGLQTTVGLGQGKLSLADGVVMNGYENVGLFSGVRVNRGLLDAVEQTMFDTKRGPVNADAFRRFLHRAVDGNWVKNGSIANAKR